MQDIADLIAGFKRFQERYFSEDRDLFERLGRGQRPKAMIVACADSRVDPALLTGAVPGDVFVVRNVANLVDPHRRLQAEPPGGRRRREAGARARRARDRPVRGALGDAAGVPRFAARRLRHAAEACGDDPADRAAPCCGDRARGQRGLRGVLLGSETQKVLAGSWLPVLVYRGKS